MLKTKQYDQAERVNNYNIAITSALVAFKKTGDRDQLRAAIDAAKAQDERTFTEIDEAKKQLERLQKFLSTVQSTTASGFVWKGRDIDNLETEQLYTDSDFVLAFLYRSELEDLEAPAKEAYLEEYR